MTSEQWLIKAVAYFGGTMTTEEARAFETETAANEELADLMKLWKQTDAEASVYEKYKQEIEALAETHQHLKKDFIGTRNYRAKHVRIWKWMAAAAVLAAIILLGNVLLRNAKLTTPVIVNYQITDSLNKTDTQRTVTDSTNQSPFEKNQTDLQVLYAQNFTPDKVPDDPNGPLDDAYFYYASGQYKNAITAIDSLHKKQLTRGGAADASTNLFAQYYKALSLMSLGNIEPAIPLLRQVESSDNPELRDRAQWYLSLAYLKQNEPSNAIRVLEKLTGKSSTGAYKSKASRLLSELRK
jgi:hypothetical protein